MMISESFARRQKIKKGRQKLGERLWALLLPVLKAKMNHLKELEQLPRDMRKSLEKDYEQIKAKVKQMSSAHHSETVSEKEDKLLKSIRKWSDQVFLHVLKCYLHS